jgi:hypothetical protein
VLLECVYLNSLGKFGGTSLHVVCKGEVCRRGEQASNTIVSILPFVLKLYSANMLAQCSYVFDYAIIMYDVSPMRYCLTNSLSRILLGGFLALDAIEPYHQEFSLQNYTLHYKYAVHERVPNLALVAIAVAAPMAIISIYTMVVDGLFSHRVNGLKKKYSIKDRLWELNCGLLGLGLAIAMQYVIVGKAVNKQSTRSSSDIT